MTATTDLPALLGELETAGALTETSLSLSDPEMPFERWEALAEMMGRLRSANCFWIGDLLNFGEGVYGERYAQGMEAFGLEYRTLTNYAYVCRNVARSRRSDRLSFAHHREVAPLDPAEQADWLTNAAEAGWSRSQLRDALRAIPAGGGEPAEPRGGGVTLEAAARGVWVAAQRNGVVYEVPIEPMTILGSLLTDE